MSKYYDALKVLFFFVLGNFVCGFVFRFILEHFSPAYLNPTVLMPTFALQATIILFFLSKKYHFNCYLNHEGFSYPQLGRGLVLSIAFAMPVLATVIAYSGGEFRIELTNSLLKNNRTVFFIALAYSEELIFRGLLLGIFSPMVGLHRAIIFQALLFSLAHWAQDFDQWLLVWRIYVGVILGYVVYKTKSLLPSFLIHMTWNCCLLIFSALSPGVFGIYGVSALGLLVITSQVPRDTTLMASVFGCLIIVALTKILFSKERNILSN